MAYSAQMLAREVVSVDPETSVLEAVRLMRSRRVGCVLAVKDGRVAGVFTERDVVNRVISEELDPRTTPVSAVMTTDPVAVQSFEPVERIFEILAQRRFRHVPVVQDGRPVGIVSLSDMAGVLREVFSDPKYLRYFVDYFVQRLSTK